MLYCKHREIGEMKHPMDAFLSKYDELSIIKNLSMKLENVVYFDTRLWVLEIFRDRNTEKLLRVSGVFLEDVTAEGAEFLDGLAHEVRWKILD